MPFQGDLDAIIFIPILSAILKCVRFKFVYLIFRSPRRKMWTSYHKNKPQIKSVNTYILFSMGNK
jgi:hypothetical protein